ncbi:rhodanese-like domain-containing protein [Rhodoplanes roseus]|uniref:Thiosulfate sulfurtransferase n=1 Tax=Rhodoplanes roseus TaxID=29409 RepID=A0A327L0J7_9BRAD|nr:rhodanese-like domain-containing protein [Rhodoplanes roseus]RAI43917.1 thiosulfate sulfurtransferase [Rhodoplanes roseus]
MPTTTPAELRRHWRERREIALLDLREEADFAAAHPFFAVSLPLAQIEARLPDLAPRRDVPVVIYDDGEGLTAPAMERIAALGYTEVAVLDGGLAAYRAVGEVFRDVNVPSKAFGELVEAICHTPSHPAEDVQRLLAQHPETVVLDARRFEEYRTMSIPGGRSLPGGELALRIFDAAPSDVPVIVNCAGRTRSIIGTQTLVNLGVPQKVAALRNGTIGWTLAGLPLDHGRAEAARTLSSEGHARARDAAGRWAERVGVRVLDRGTYAAWVAERGARTLHRLDVRSPEEHAAGHPEGFVSAPGGQLVQATDEWVAVRGARLALFDDDGVRARMTASWLVQMGWDAAVIGDGVVVPDQTGVPARPPVPAPARPYKRPYEGTDNPRAAMQAYIDWELGLVAQLANDGVANFRVVRPAAAG